MSSHRLKHVEFEIGKQTSCLTIPTKAWYPNVALKHPNRMRGGSGSSTQPAPVLPPPYGTRTQSLSSSSSSSSSSRTQPSQRGQPSASAIVSPSSSHSALPTTPRETKSARLRRYIAPLDPFDVGISSQGAIDWRDGWNAKVLREESMTTATSLTSPTCKLGGYVDGRISQSGQTPPRRLLLRTTSDSTLSR